MKTRVRLEAVSFAESASLFLAFSKKCDKLMQGWHILVEADKEKAELVRQADIEQEIPLAVSKELFSQIVTALNEFARTEGFPFRFRLSNDFLVVAGSGVLTVRVKLTCRKIEDEVR